MDRPTKIWPGMNPRPAEGETRDEFEARWGAITNEMMVFTQESLRMANEMQALPWYKFFTQVRMLRECERRNKLARELLIVEKAMAEAYMTHEWPKQPLNLH